MDTDDEYLESDFYVRLAGERNPDWIVDYHKRRIEVKDNNIVGYSNQPLRDHHIMDEDLPIDGQITFYNPKKIENAEPAFYFDFPFRAIEKNDSPWFVYPDREKGSRFPVWKWTNSERDPHEHLDLNPSLGVGDSFHCYINEGKIKWL